MCLSGFIQSRWRCLEAGHMSRACCPCTASPVPHPVGSQQRITGPFPMQLHGAIASPEGEPSVVSVMVLSPFQCPALLGPSACWLPVLEGSPCFTQISRKSRSMSRCTNSDQGSVSDLGALRHMTSACGSVAPGGLQRCQWLLAGRPV